LNENVKGIKPSTKIEKNTNARALWPPIKSFLCSMYGGVLSEVYIILCIRLRALSDFFFIFKSATISQLKTRTSIIDLFCFYICLCYCKFLTSHLKHAFNNKWSNSIYIGKYVYSQGNLLTMYQWLFLKVTINI